MKTPIHFRITLFPVVLLLCLIGLFGLYVHLMNPDVMGWLYDDGIYLMAAKSLASVQGYRLIHMLGQPELYKYPPLFPLLLTSGLRFFQETGTAIASLKIVNISLAIGWLGLLWHFLNRHMRLGRWLALGVTLMLATHWRLVEVAIELMSEPLFLLCSLLLLLVACRIEEKDDSVSIRDLSLLIVLSTLAFYTRTLGIVLILSVAAWLALQKDRRNLLGYISGTGLLCAPWIVFSAGRHTPVIPIQDFLIRSFQESYFQSLRMDLQYEYSLLTLYGKGAGTLIGNLSLYVFPWLSKLAAMKNPMTEAVVLLLSFAFCLVLGFRTYQGLKTRRFTLVGLYCMAYLIILPFWGYFSFYPRFLLAILPLLIAQVLQAIQDGPLSQRTKQGLAGGLIAIGLISNIAFLSPYLAKPHRNMLFVNHPADMWSEYQFIFGEIQKHTAPTDVLYSDNIDECYLYAMHTGRTLADFFPFLPKEKLPAGGSVEAQKAALHAMIVQRAEVTYQALRRFGVRYLIVHKGQKTHLREWMPKSLPITPLMLARHPQAFIPVAQSPGGQITLYRLNPHQP